LFRTVVKLAQDTTLPLEAVGPIDIFHRRETSSRFYYAMLTFGNATKQSGGFDAKFLKPFCRTT
jgi:hypothetical protein